MKFRPNLYWIVGIFAIIMFVIVSCVIQYHDDFTKMSQGVLSVLGVLFCVLGCLEKKQKPTRNQ